MALGCARYSPGFVSSNVFLSSLMVGAEVHPEIIIRITKALPTITFVPVREVSSISSPYIIIISSDQHKTPVNIILAGYS